jgi:integrase
VLIADWRFWAPAIALLSGARVSEIAQLRPRDVTEVAGHWFLDINDERGRFVKTRAGVRKVPVQRELVRLGILELAEERRAQGHALLLPEVPKPVGGDPGQQLSKWMSEKFLPRLALKKRRGFGFHSFRHGMATMLRSAEVQDRTCDLILGHASEGQGARYGEFQARLLHEAINRIELPPEIGVLSSRAAQERSGRPSYPSGHQDRRPTAEPHTSPP